MGNSFYNAMRISSTFTKFVFEKRAMSAVKKRNRVFLKPSPYVEKLLSTKVGDNYSIGGKTSTSNLYDYITDYSYTEILVYKRNQKVGTPNPAIEEKMSNPPELTAGNLNKKIWVKSIRWMCIKDMLFGMKVK